eukprot:scaffold88659_cov15-Tisochrysis_lutea.AAC.1
MEEDEMDVGVVLVSVGFLTIAKAQQRKGGGCVFACIIWGHLTHSIPPSTHKHTQDDEAKEAIRVAENVMRTYSMEQALESEFEPSLQESLAARLSKRIDAEGTIDPVLGQTLTAVSDNEGTEVVEEDWQGATGYSKFDDEEMYAVSPQDQQASV